jgi:hypothetical protein
MTTRTQNRRRTRRPDPVANPSARIYITGIGPELPSQSNPGSFYHELSVDIGRLGQLQGGRSFIDPVMDNWETAQWANRVMLLQDGYTLVGTGVTRQTTRGDEYLDVDHFEPTDVLDAAGRSILNQ